MAELTTIARPYAEAAFRIASDANALPVWSEMLRFLCAVTAEPRAAAALDNPRLTAADKTALLLSIGGERLDASGRSFVRVLVDADRIAALPQIRTLFETLKNDADGVAKARIDTAFPLTDAQAGELKAALERKFGRKIEATVHVDPALGGGARITVGDTVIDGTVEAQLAAMSTQLRT
jgi:F-type H+-transporting ATPase subunit delta